jgi:hypothetical protein
MEEMIIEQCKKQGLPLPDKIANAPSLHSWNELWFSCFSDLNTSRTMGMSLGPISWITIAQWALAMDIHGEQLDDLFYHVEHLDDAYMKHQRTKTSKPTPAPPAGRKIVGQAT